MSSVNVLELAEEQARGLHHSYVGTEHILLALLTEPDNPARTALGSLGVTRERVRKAVVQMMGIGVEGPAGELPLTDAAENAIEGAELEAQRAGQGHVGAEHLLLALVQQPRGAATRILMQLDADPEAIRAAVTGDARST